jgi:VWFA-related protein
MLTTRLSNINLVVGIAICLLFAITAGNLNGQQQTTPGKNAESRPPETTEEVGEGDVLRVDTNLVAVPVMVLDRRGHYVIDLQRSEFHIFENGVEQNIAHFSSVDHPFSIVLLIDTSGSTAPFLQQIKDAAKAFVEQLRPADTVYPVYFHGEIKALTNAGTNDRNILETAIDRIEAGPINMGTRLYDAVAYGLTRLHPESQRKAIILLTDGGNTWGRATMKGTLNAAEESGVIVYSVQYGTDPPDRYLQELARRTGGRYFGASDTTQIRQSFAGIADELRRQYLIGYYTNEKEARVQRKIKVKVDRKNVAVVTRQ